MSASTTEATDATLRELPLRPQRGERFDPIDWDYMRSLIDEVYGDVVSRYFRARLIGADKLPERGPLIVAPNHSGNAFPHDGIALDALLWRHDDYDPAAKFRSVYTPALTATWWMRPFGIDNWWRRGGGVDMSFDNYDRLLERGDRVIHYPEGVPGIGKGFTRRYQLQHFHSSFVVLAARHEAPVYPISIVNAEWVNPTSVTFKPLNKLFRKLLGLPFFPVPIVFLALLFPFIFYLGFPCKMRFVVQDPVDVRGLLHEEGCDDLDAPNREVAQRVTERVRRIAQRQLDEAVREHGDQPYDLAGFWENMRALKDGVLAATPLGWPVSFVRHERDRRRPPAKNKLHAFARDLDLLAYYLPFGWLLLAAARRLRKPPYGYRGLSPKERREVEGCYRWSLDERPLPERDA